MGQYDSDVAWPHRQLNQKPLELHDEEEGPGFRHNAPE